MDAKLTALIDRFWKACEQGNNAANIAEISKSIVTNLEVEVDRLEKKVAALEGQIQAQPRLTLLVAEIKETPDINIVNVLIHQNWIVLNIIPKESDYLFSLGRVDFNRLSQISSSEPLLI